MLRHLPVLFPQNLARGVLLDLTYNLDTTREPLVLRDLLLHELCNFSRVAVGAAGWGYDVCSGVLVSITGRSLAC